MAKSRLADKNGRGVGVKSILARMLLAFGLVLTVGSGLASAAGNAGDLPALRQEDKLLDNLEEKSLSLQDGDAQQLMLAAFGRRFSPTALNDIPDKLLRDQLGVLQRDGYTFLQSEGMYYLAVDYQKLLNDFECTLGTEVRDYLQLQAQETNERSFQDAGIAISRIALGRRATAAERFLQRYPESYRRSQVSDLYFAYASAFLFGTDNSPLRDKNGTLKSETSEAWTQLLREAPQTQLAAYVRALQAAEQASLDERSAAYKAVRVALAEKVFLLYQGVYSGVRGQATLLMPNGGAFFLEDRFGVAERADELTNGEDTGAPILMQIRGVVNRSLPEKGMASLYGRTLVVDRVSSVSQWALDDATMPFVLVGIGTEPFWHVRILENGFVFFQQLGEPVQLFAVPAIQTLTDGTRYSLKRADGARLIIDVRRVAEGVSDGMSNAIYPCAVSVTIDGKTLKGSGFTQTEKIRHDI